MKTISRFFPPPSGFICALITLLITADISPACAQPNPDGPPRRQPPRDFQPDQGPGQRPQPGFQGGGPAGQYLRLLNRVLTEDQRASLRETAEAQRDQVREPEQALRQARKELLNASLAEKFDEAVVRAKALEVSKLEAELTVLRAKALSQVRPPLSPEQIEKLKNPPPMDLGPGGGEFRPEPRRRGYRPPPGPRDENDLPPGPPPPPAP